MGILYTWSQCLGWWCGLVCENIFEFWVLGQISRKKGSWTVRLSHFSKFFTDDMIWWCDMMIWYDDMIWWCDMMIVLTRVVKIFWILGVGANFQENKGSWTVDLVIFQSFLLMIWYDDVIWWYDMTIWYDDVIWW